MVVEARIRIRHRTCFTERLSGGGTVVQLSAGREGDVLALQASDPAQLAGLLALVGEAGEGQPEVVHRTPTSAVVRTRLRHRLAADITAAGCTPLWPALFAGGEEAYTLLAPARDRLDALLVHLSRHGEVALERAREVAPGEVNVNVPLADITTSLTQRQLLVLQTAIAEGYYASPRRTSTEALAATFGVTRSTLEEHLRKAERRVLEGFADVLSAQPVIARAAARRPGRPARVTSVR